MNEPVRLRAQGVSDADRDIRMFLIALAGNLGEVLGEALVGIYVHGSLAHGTFRRDASNIDVLAVVEAPLDPTLRAAVARTLLRLSDTRPMPGDLELTVITRASARSFESPLPFEVRYGEQWHDAIRDRLIDYSMQRLDPQLAAAVVDTVAHGVRLVGPQSAELFGPVPWYALINAIEDEFVRAGERATDAPADVILNAAQTLHGATSRTVELLPKESAARWALGSVPSELRPTLVEALDVRTGVRQALSAETFAAIAPLRRYVLERAGPAFERARDTGDEEDDENLTL